MLLLLWLQKEGRFVLSTSSRAIDNEQKHFWERLSCFWSIDRPADWLSNAFLGTSMTNIFLLQKGFKSNLFQVELVFWFLMTNIQNKYLLASKCWKWFYLRQLTIAIGLHFLQYLNHSNFILRQNNQQVT
jgi:hypothetical protein